MFLQNCSRQNHCVLGVALCEWEGTRLEQEPPLLIVEQADDGCDDDGSLRILGHVAEDWREAQQHNHHYHTCAMHTPHPQIKQGTPISTAQQATLARLFTMLRTQLPSKLAQATSLLESRASDHEKQAAGSAAAKTTFAVLIEGSTRQPFTRQNLAGQV